MQRLGRIFFAGQMLSVARVHTGKDEVHVGGKKEKQKMIKMSGRKATEHVSERVILRRDHPQTSCDPPRIPLPPQRCAAAEFRGLWGGY